MLLHDIPVNISIEQLYHLVQEKVETSTPDGKWKLMIITTSLRTLKWNEKERLLNEYGVEINRTYRIEVVLDMGACHGSLCRK